MFKNIVFSSSELELLKKSFKKMNVKKGDVLISAGQEVDIQYYVDDGCLRSFFADETGKEYTLMFAIKDWWISDYTAYFTNAKSMVSIECIQDATLYSISEKEVHYLFKVLPKIESFFRRKMEKAFAGFQKRILASISQSATERYRTFIETYPEIEKIVKNYHIASYLGITTESLSRIRKEIAKT